MRPRFTLMFLCILLLATAAAEARVISYAPYTDHLATASYHRRDARHFLLIESRTAATSPPLLILMPPFPAGPGDGQLVLYDTTSANEPRVVYPADGSSTPILWAAMRENAQQVPTILVAVASKTTNTPSYLLSTDGGSSWKPVTIPGNTSVQNWYTDVGGPFTRGRYSQVRLGTPANPFFVHTSSGVYTVGSDATARLLYTPQPAAYSGILGTNADGSEVLVATGADRLGAVRLDGTVRDIGPVDPKNAPFEGWIAPNGAAFVESRNHANNTVALLLVRNGEALTLADNLAFAVPQVDYNGAWMIRRAVGAPTTLLRYRIGNGLTTEWNDVTGPEVEALHPGATGNTLLVQVHRPRREPDRIIIDPALAVWRVGEGAPKEYDELFMNEAPTKGFLHLDVERVADGDPFVFDSGISISNGGPIISPAPSGGADVIQEWGVVRASLKQRLVLPGIGRTPGAYGSNWASDVILYNPFATEQHVDVQFAANGVASSTAVTQRVTLNGKEIRVIPDVLKTLFGLENGGGALFLHPQRGINATSRTYTRTTKGSFGYGMNAIDVHAAASARFPVSFSGAFPGLDFRTNITLTDATVAGSDTALHAFGGSGRIATHLDGYAVPSGSQQQYNGVGSRLGVQPWESGGLIVVPRRGFLVASVFAIDNRTNDPTYFPPDLPSALQRTIAVIGHVDGANDSKFRTDLYLFNPSTRTQTITLTAQPWNTTESPVSVPMTMLPNEARVIKDAYYALFGKTGLAKLRYQSFDTAGIRLTSRTYSIDDQGGTFGFLTPPLNGFQMVATGETLEILGVIGGKDFRTNLGLVEMNQQPANNLQPAAARVEIIDDKGVTIDSFSVNVAIAGGMQISDIFRNRDLGDGPPAARIRITALRGQIAAYATVTDNGTNDSMYLAPNLAATE